MLKKAISFCDTHECVQFIGYYFITATDLNDPRGTGVMDAVTYQLPREYGDLCDRMSFRNLTLTGEVEDMRRPIFKRVRKRKVGLASTSHMMFDLRSPRSS